MTPATDRRPTSLGRRSQYSLRSAGGVLVATISCLVVFSAGQISRVEPTDPTVVDRTIDETATLFIDPTVIPSPFVPSEPSSAFGLSLLDVDVGVVAIGQQGIRGATASVLVVPATGAITIGDVVLAERSITAANNTLVVVDARRIRVLEIGTEGTLIEIGSYQRTDDATFGDIAAMGANTVAITREPPEGEPAFVDVFDLSHGVTPVVALAPGLERISVAVDSAGDLVAVSGVRDRGETGEVQFFRRSTQAWLVDARFDAIGGGAVRASSSDPATFHVQRNGFFTRPTGTWSLIASDEDGALAIDRELLVQSSSLAMADGMAAFGMPNSELVMTFDVAEDGIRHVQRVVAPIPVPTDGTPTPQRPPVSRFGSSVAFVNGRLLVAGPGAAIDGVADEGLVFAFDATVGPAGCTITGTNGDDTLNGTTADDVICGLGGNDLIRGNLGFDRIYGGPGDDDISGDADDDLLVGGDGHDRLAGGAGDDWILGGPGDDALYGGAGNDHLDGGEGRDACYGGAGIDTFENC